VLEYTFTLISFLSFIFTGSSRKKKKMAKLINLMSKNNKTEKGSWIYHRLDLHFYPLYCLIPCTSIEKVKELKLFMLHCMGVRGIRFNDVCTDIMKRKIKQRWSTIPLISTKLTTISLSLFEIQVLARDRHKNIAGKTDMYVSSSFCICSIKVDHLVNLNQH